MENLKNTEISGTFEKIYGEESDAIFRFCAVRVSNREQALDLTQETFLRFWQSLCQNQEIRNVRAFLFTIAHRLIIDWYRKKKSVSLEGIMQKKGNMNAGAKYDSYDLPDEKTRESLDMGPEGRYLVRKIDELNPTSRDPVYLSFVEGLSPREIGDILGITANAASVRINRGLNELRKLIGYAKVKEKKEN